MRDKQIGNEKEKNLSNRSLSMSQLMWRKFRRNRLALIALFLIILLYSVVLMAEFFVPYSLKDRDLQHRYQPPQRIQFFDEKGNFYMRPFVYELEEKLDPVSFRRTYEANHSKKYPIYFFVRSETPHAILGIFESKLKFFGVKEGVIYLFGTNDRGTCVLTQTIHGGRISLTIGIVGVILSIILGSIIGVASGYFGGLIDHYIQRGIELMLSFPRIPLWMALGAALPPHWSSIRVFFAITVILSLIGWGGLARQLRGKVMALREEDFVFAARAMGANPLYIILKHFIPNCGSHIIVIASLSMPAMIIGETSLSFLGLGIRRPMVSWGSLLQVAQNVSAIMLYPWYIIPGLFVIAAVLLFNFLGDGIRDAADPYSS